jgi:hypothetical protein
MLLLVEIKTLMELTFFYQYINLRHIHIKFKTIFALIYLVAFMYFKANIDLILISVPLYT